MTNTNPNRPFNRRQAIQTGIAGIAGVTGVGLNSQATAQQTEPVPTMSVYPYINVSSGQGYLLRYRNAND
jgi:hypothetical protein